MPFATVNSGASKHNARASISADAENPLPTVRLRVTCWKSAYFTFSVTVQPWMPFASR
jgi:hypothetical protein